MPTHKKFLKPRKMCEKMRMHSSENLGEPAEKITIELGKTPLHAMKNPVKYDRGNKSGILHQQMPNLKLDC
ncbi:unnamed protein product [marine sediment metagenome]|uniref:Uncharacterized protein n=1 Tax=marine sediment metagenome TaxID=412755 RepID=X1IJU6_9ZZZZ